MISSVAFVGLGNMGVPMALRIGATGLAVRGFDISPAARETAAGAGLDVVDGLEQLAADAVVLMLPSSAVVEAVLWDQGLAQILRPGAVVVDMSSSEPLRTQALAERLEAIGVRLVDAPVSGGVVGARNGALTIMVGGDQELVAEISPLLETMGTVRHVGTVGAGHALKALNNLMSAAHMLASSEAVTAARRFGIDPEVALEVVNASSGRSFSTEFKWPRFILPETYDSGFALGLLVKDARIATELARGIGVPARLGEAVLELWEQAADELPPGADHTHIAEFAARSGADD